ncbi:hypothetical protein [Ideonella sp. B508-1]|uniref:hypothetical protein n=1 Tax=Ideonella sp. B508-1 TaxID=137716 RepID=UPI000344DC16|nr:hypothetical protein [Ideonella sp. B508-1]
MKMMNTENQANQVATNHSEQLIAEVRRIDAADCAAIGAMSKSWWSQKVKEGIAPQPVVQKKRETRWLLREVIDFWKNYPNLVAQAQ